MVRVIVFDTVNERFEISRARTRLKSFEVNNLSDATRYRLMLFVAQHEWTHREYLNLKIYPDRHLVDVFTTARNIAGETSAKYHLIYLLSNEAERHELEFLSYIEEIGFMLARYGEGNPLLDEHIAFLREQFDANNDPHQALANLYADINGSE